MAKEKKKSTYNSLTVDELKNTEKQLREQIFKLKLQKSTGQLADTATVKKNQKDLARVLTSLTVKNAEANLKSKR
jgi:large subunit ribosomal protein L29